MSKEPKLRQRPDRGNTMRVETWWKPEVRSDSLAPVSLPIGLESTMTTMFRHLPSKKQQAKSEFLSLTREM
jgi:hypothetical protein